eukprot:TRINITY_DN7149_c0_g1_i2.p1 TRINITY_DN7149_c0_g1~~TRINITY_DN7149_c0_g1_i2.p1  ORF type:complete len:588 (+),score=74.81 TRINITY_DN7149_c0_g1_i2:30-1766(+)
MEVEEEENTQLEAYLKILEFPDSIMEPNVLDTLRTFMVHKGTPSEAIRALSGSYQGYAQMCNLVSNWLNIAGTTQVSDLVENYLKNNVIQEFNPKQADTVLFSSQQAPGWLTQLTQTPKWRNLIYTLSKQHPDCQLLNFTIQLISEAGHQREIASLTSASIYFNVFNRVLQETLEDILKAKNPIELDALLPDFLQMCTHNQHTYLYCQSVLQILTQDKRFAHLRKLSTDLQTHVQHLPVAQNISRLMVSKDSVVSCPEDLFNLISSITRAGKITPMVAEKLHFVFSSPSPPPVSLIRKEAIFKYLIGDLYSPPTAAVSSLSSASDEHKQHGIYLLAYLSCKREDSAPLTPEEREEITELIPILTLLQDACQKHIVGRELQALSNELYKSVKCPVASMCLLHWISLSLKDSTWYLTNVNTKSLDILLDILNEITLTHTFQHQYVFSILVSSFAMETSLDALATLTVKKKIIDSLVFLMEHGWVLPVLQEVHKWTTKRVDQSLIRYFTTKLLVMAGPPYSHEFLSPVLQIINKLSDISLSIGEYTAVLIPFLKECYNSTEYDLSEQEKRIVFELLEKSKA